MSILNSSSFDSLSEHFESEYAAIEGAFDAPWSDGLPIVPPTIERIERMIAAGGRDRDEGLGTLKERDLTLHVWQAAASAVMAGCKPEYFPVVLASWDAAFDPAFNLNTVLSSTGGAAIAAIVSGPYGERIDMRSGSGLFSPGNRANATIGRAMRIAAMSVLKALPGELDASTFGHHGKGGFHFAESEPPAGWKSARERLGFSADATTVTLLSGEAPRQVMHRWKPSVHDMLSVLATAMRMPAGCSTGGDAPFFVLLGPEHAGVLRDGGLGPEEIAQELSVLSRISADELLRAGINPASQGNHYKHRDTQGNYITASPEHILVATAGGPGAGWSMVVPSWSTAVISALTTRKIVAPSV